VADTRIEIFPDDDRAAYSAGPVYVPAWRGEFARDMTRPLTEQDDPRSSLRRLAVQLMDRAAGEKLASVRDVLLHESLLAWSLARWVRRGTR
jgi:hypothetical protein